MTCQADLEAGTIAIWDRTERTVTCLGCSTHHRTAPEPADRPTPAQVRSGPAGGSALVEAERRRARQAAREARIKAKHPIRGRLALALFPEPDAGRSYAKGAVGEQVLGQFLDALHANGVLTLHDRRLPRSTANIDHLVVAGGGVWVIDAKRYQGRPERAWGKLRVNGRDQTKLVSGVHKQVAHVRAALDRAGVEGVDVHGCLCFIHADIGLIQRPFSVDGVFVTWRKPLGKRLLEPGALTLEDRLRLQHLLSRAFRPAIAS